MSRTSDTAEMWEEEREAYKQRRDKRLAVRTKEILALTELGYTVEMKTEYQYRINNLVDLFPVNNQFHNIKDNRRGHYKNITAFIKSEIRKEQEQCQNKI